MKKQIITIICIIVGTIAIFGFRFNVNKQNVLNTIKTECNCQQITKGISMHGITFSKDTGVNLGDTHTFTLQNCTFDSFEKNIESLTNRLSSEIDNLHNSGVVILDIKNDEDLLNQVIIKNGKWKLK